MVVVVNSNVIKIVNTPICFAFSFIFGFIENVLEYMGKEEKDGALPLLENGLRSLRL